jgi:hypothetical protein
MSNRYDSRSIKAFADALTGITNSQVSVRVGGAEACTNGRVIHLPDAGVWEEGDFAALCGVACHEVAHVWFGAPSMQQRFVKPFRKPDRRLAALCFNAVIDVADETRFEQAFPRAQRLFEFAAEACLDNVLRTGIMPTRPPSKANSPVQLIAAAIWLVRSRPHSNIRRKFRGWRTRTAGAAEAVRILNRARERAQPMPFVPARSPSEWRRLFKIARMLFDLVEQSFPPSQRRRGRWLKSHDPMKQWRKAVVREAGEEAQIAESTGIEANCDDWRQACKPPLDPFSRLRAAMAACESVTYDESCYRRLFPAFRRQALTLARGPDLTVEYGHASGSRLGRPHRALTDGKCFRRTITDEGTNAAFALAFDHSHSMCEELGSFLPVGAALAEALAAVPDVELSLWRFGSEVERVNSTEELKHPRLMGSTRTDLALQEAHGWLRFRSAGHKTVILFTDGAPDEAEMTASACMDIRRCGVRILAGAFGVDLVQCIQTLPGAIVFNIDPGQVASSLHIAIKRLQW